MGNNTLECIQLVEKCINMLNEADLDNRAYRKT